MNETDRRAQAAPVGFPLFVVPDEDGRLQFHPYEVSVREGMRAILMTRPGERLARPDFGAGLAGFVHAPNTVETRRRIRDVVIASLRRWEDRADVERVDVSEIADRPAEVRVEIIYRLRRTGAVEKLGLSMDLGG